MDAALPSEFVEGSMRAWYVIQKSKNELATGFSPSLKTTPLSVFADDKWCYPPEFTAPGNQTRVELHFLGRARATHGRFAQLDKTVDCELIEQLKQSTYLFTFHREKAADNRKLVPISVSTIYKTFMMLRKIFVTMKVLGFRSLCELKPNNISILFAEIDAPAKQFNEYAQLFNEIYLLCTRGLIPRGIPISSFFIPLKTIVANDDDNGVDALEIEDIERILDTSLLYIDKHDLICEAVSLIKENEANLPAIHQWACDLLPTDDKYLRTPGSTLTMLSTLVQISAYNLIGFHLGWRPSEAFSSQLGFVGMHHGEGVMFTDRMTLKAETVKTARKLYGLQRYFPVHPYIVEVAGALTSLHNALGLAGNHLFASPVSGKIYSTSHFNIRMEVFARANGFQTDLSSYTWRKSMPGVVTAILQDGLEELAELLGHQSIEQTAVYASASPWLHEAVSNLARNRMEEHTRSLLTEASAAGGAGLGGAASNALEQIASEAAKGAPRAGREELFADEARSLLEAGVVSLKVNDDTSCFKPAIAQGLCTVATGNLLADTERCVAECIHRVERGSAKGGLLEAIKTMTTFLQSDSAGKLEKFHWCTDLYVRVKGFPDLKALLDAQIDANPEIAFWFR